MGKFLQNKKILLGLILVGIFIIPFTALALELNWPPSPGTRITLTVSTPLPKLVQYLYEWGITLGGLAVFIVLLIAGFQYLTSVGEPTRMKEAMDRIKSAFLGLVLLLSSWLILNTINPELTTFRLPPTDLGKIGQLECDTPADCPDGYQCTDPCPNGSAANSDCVSSPVLKEGVCIKEKEEKKTCKGAYVECSEGSKWMEPGEAVPCSAPKFVKTFIEKDKISCCDDEAYKKGYYSCGCYLQVFSGAAWYKFWTTCGDMEAIVPGCEENIVDYTDKAIQCVKVIKSSY